MVVIKMGEFASRFPHWSMFNGEVIEQKSTSPILRGRLVKRTVLPYFNREEIDSMGLIRNKSNELAYADPIDVFVLQIQGSGVVQFSDGSRLRIGYAAQNGYPYVPIGRFLLGKIPKESMSMQAIENELRSMPFYEAQDLLNQNPSYVFFDVLDSDAVTSLGTPVRPGRTIATDRQYFPKGALAFLLFEKPVFANEAQMVPDSWSPASRFVMDQDTGGAIRGPGRLDLYWGRGKVARQSAGVIKNRGQLYYLIPKAK